MLPKLLPQLARSFGYLCHIIGLCSLYIIPVSASEPAVKHIDVVASHLTISALFLRLSEQAGISLVMQGDMNLPVHVRWHAMPPRQAMQQLCDVALVTCYWQRNQQPALWQQASHLMVVANDQIPQQTFITKIVSLDYAQGQSIAAILNSEAGLLKGGSATIDEATEQIILWLPRSQLTKVMHVIEALDKPLPQVQIEARIVIARRDASTNLRNGLTTEINNSALSDSNQLSATVGQSQNLSAVSLALIAPHIMLSLELAALEASGQVLTLAQPQVVVQSGRQGSIATGQEVPFVTQEDGKTTHQWKQAVLGLTVSPRVLPDQQVFMDLSVAQDSVGELLANGALALNTHRLQTQVRIGIGQTLVLGGALYEQQLQRLLQNPAWMSLPIFKRWMHEQQQQNQQMELLVFVTPRLAEPWLS